MPTLLSQSTARSLHDLTLAELELALAPLHPVHARTLWRAVYRESAIPLSERTDFVPPLRRWVAENLGVAFPLTLPASAADTASSDGLTRKFLLRLHDGETIETVLMGYPGRQTVCLSSQAGCAMGCVFCATGQGGFTRHLAPGEIVAQVLHAQRALEQGGGRGGDKESGRGGVLSDSPSPPLPLPPSSPRLRNLVLMGMGEPLHNYDAVMAALEIITDPRGLGIGPRHVTISTVGVVPGILRMAREQRPYHLAVSLHGATEEERSALVPISRRWPLAELMAACRTYGESTGRRIFFEWTLIAGTNDSPASAARLAALLQGLDAHVNLIPLNLTPGFQGVPTATLAAFEFQRVLREARLPSTIRQRRGLDVDAGCGQLRAAGGRNDE